MLECRQKWLVVVIGSFLIGIVAFGSCVGKSSKGVPEVLPSQLRPDLGHQRVVFLDRKPDGKHILVSAYRRSFLRGMFGQTDPYNIHLVSTEDLELRRIVSDEREFAVAFSADGREIVYHTSDEDTGHTTGIYVMDVDGSNRRRLGDDWWDVARQGGGLAE